MSREASRLGATFLREPLDARPPRRRQDRGHRKQGEKNQRRMYRHQECDRHAKPQDPTARREQRHVHVIQHEHLIAQDRQPIEILRTFLVRNRRHARLKPSDVRFESDRHLVAEATLDAGADRAKKPCGRCGDTQTDRRCGHESGRVIEHAFAEEHQPERDQRIRQRSHELQG